jgi:hypothetical protein
MEFEFPFDVPDDLDGLSRQALEELFTKVQAHGKGLADDASLVEVDATFTLFSDLKTRRDAFIEGDKKRAAFSTDDGGDSDADDTDDAGDGDADDTDDGATDDATDDGAADDDAKAKADALTAARGKGTGKKGRKPVARNAPPNDDQTPPNGSGTALATMTVAANVPNFRSGQELDSFALAASAIQEQILTYGVQDKAPTGPRSQPHKRTNIVHSATERAEMYATDPSGRMHRLGQNFTRHGAIRFNRHFPDDQRILAGDDAYAKVLRAADEKRLPGGNLRESATLAVKEGRALTAAAGWCAASETIYQLCELESMDGILDLPELEASRGGFNIPEDGGVDFSTIFNGIGSAGDTHLSEYDVQNDTTKVCYEIPCPDFVDTRLGVDYVCLTAGLLQRRGYPEVVSRVSRGAMVALAHKINQGVIDAIVTAAGAASVIPADPGGDDAAAALLSAVELGIVDMKYRHRMPFASTMEVMLPLWTLTVIRAALARRNGVGLLGVSDTEILNWFTIRGAVPRFVYDWQDALAGLVGGPGGAVALTALPDTLDFVIYPAGTFTKAVQPVVNLDTIYDSTLLATNEYTALFAEDGWAVLQTCPDARQYTVEVDVSGCVGCIAAGTS